MILDVRTTFVLLGLLYLILPVTVLVLLKNYRELSVRLWCIGGLIVGVSLLGLGMRPYIETKLPAFVVLTLNNTILIFGYLIRFKSLRIDLKRPVPNIAIFIACLTFMVLFELGRINNNIEFRTELAYFSSGLVTFLLAYTAYQYEKVYQVKHIQFIWMSYLALSISLFVRCIFIILGWEEAVPFQNSFLNTLVGFFGILTVIYSNLAYVGVILEKVEKDRVSHQKKNSILATALDENVQLNQVLEERNTLLRKLVKAKKIAELGAMTASIAHEVNQPLSSIKLNLWALKRIDEKEQRLTDEQQQLISDLSKDTQRATDIVKALRSVFLNQSPDSKVISLSKLFATLKPIIATDLEKQDIQIRYQISKGLKLYINENEFNLVMLNLVNNSVKALLKANEEQKNILIQAFAEDGFIKVEVIDNGPGVPKNLVPNLFDIAKDSKSSGLGLGLWLSKYIVERYAGSIEYKENVPQGSIFTLKFSN